MKCYDITFVGHMCFDEISPFAGNVHIAPGSAVLCGAMAAARIGKKVAVVAKMSAEDVVITEPMKQAGIDVFVIPAEQTTYMQVLHPTADVDVRQMFQKKNAGFITLDEMPAIKTNWMHLAGITDQEFTLELIEGLNRKGYRLTTDMQSFVRQVDPETREISFNDVLNKKAIFKLVERVKLDIVEAKLLTGSDNLELSAMMMEEWGCPEIVITKAEGALARARRVTYYERFSNDSVVGRTGRGDTMFAAYLARRMEYSVADSLKFAAALVSIKMETPGPFKGTLDDVLHRMRQKHCA